MQADPIATLEGNYDAKPLSNDDVKPLLSKDDFRIDTESLPDSMLMVAGNLSSDHHGVSKKSHRVNSLEEQHACAVTLQAHFR